MKNVFILLVVALASVFFASCRKCYQCRNQCEVCRKERHDTTLTITVYSDRLTEQYYVAYIDSITSPSVGWTCKDTASTYTEEYCKSSVASDAGLQNERDKGLICTQ